MHTLTYAKGIPLMPNTSRSQSRHAVSKQARGRVRRSVPLALQVLESRELLSNTTLLWSTGATLPAPRGGPAAVVLSGTTIVAGGKTTGSATAVVQGVPTSSTWGPLPNIDIGRVGPGFVSTSGGLLVYGGGGGANGTTALNDAFMYDITGANSQDAPGMITARMQFASATDGTSQAYAIGGVSDAGVNLATVERFNATTNTWTFLTAMPASRSGAAAAFDGTGSIYVVGGSATVNGTTGTSTLSKYTVSTNTWTTLASLPINVRDAAVVFAPDGKLDVIGGISNGTAVASVETYDPATNTWSTNTALPAAVSSAAAVVDGLGRVEVIGGFDAAKQPLSAVSVSQIVKNAVAAPVFTSTIATASLTVSTGAAFTYRAVASGNPLANYSVDAGPSGMTIDPINGSLNWTAPLTFLGSVPVTIKATNPLGSVPQSFTLNVVDKTPPTVSGIPVVTGVGKTSVTLSWTAATDNIGVTGYSVYWIYTTGHSGRGGGYTTHKILLGGTNGATTLTINGLSQNTRYSLYVVAVDAAGNVGGYPGPVYVTPGAAPSSLTYTQTSPKNPGVLYNASDVANHQLTLQLSSYSFSPPTYSLVSPPAGMTVNPATGVVTWTPAATNVGTTNVTFQSTNQFGTSSLIVPVIVTADVPIPGFLFTNTSSPTFDIVGQPVSLQITDGSNTTPTFSIDVGVTGMTIDPVTGVVNWIPTPDQAGNPQVTFRVTNSAGTATVNLGPVISVASPPRNVTVTGLQTLTPTLNWTAPAYNANLVASYRVLIGGPSYSLSTFTTSGSTLSTPLASWLSYGPGTYQVNIQALDSAGHQGLWSSVSIDYAPPILPNPAYFINSNNGNASTQFGQPVSIQLYDGNTFYKSTFSLVSGPAGVSADSNTGLVSWTPTVAQIGLQPLTFRLTNSYGTADVSLSIYVGPVTGDINPPNPTYAFTSNAGGAYAVPGQQMSLQVTDQNTAQPSVFILNSGPPGMTINSNTGVLTWTPTLGDLGLGSVSPVIEVINTVGTTYLYPIIPVVFASTINNVTASGSLSTGIIDVAWTGPAIFSEPIASYNMYLSWVDSGGVVQFALAGSAPAGSARFSLTAPAPGITTYTLYIVAVDSLGREGAMSNTGTTVILG